MYGYRVHKEAKRLHKAELKKNQENGARHRYIQFRMKNANRDVEGVHTNRE